MKRVLYDVPRWHVYLHRDSRGLGTATDRDDPVTRFEDEVFDKLYSGDLERLAEKDQDRKLGTWAHGVHRACEELPAFTRLVQECRGEPMAAGTAVETLMAVLKPQVPQDGEEKPPEAIRRALGGACEQASKAVEDLRETMDGLSEVGLIAGTGSQVGEAVNAKPIRALAARLKTDHRLKQIALLAGRFKRIAASKRRQKVRHGADEVTDIELGADLGRLLPSELVKLTRRTRRTVLIRDLMEKRAMQYQLVGIEPLGKGPLVVLLDKSGSMDGPRDIWATALSLALLDEARRMRRMFAMIAFDYRLKHESVVKPGEALPEDALFTSCAGGTEIAAAMTRGLELIRSNPGALQKADVVLVTDGGSDAGPAPRLREQAKAMGVTILGLGIGVERQWLDPWCDEVQAVTDLTHIDDTSAEMLFAS